MLFYLRESKKGQIDLRTNSFKRVENERKVSWNDKSGIFLSLSVSPNQGGLFVACDEAVYLACVA